MDVCKFYDNLKLLSEERDPLFAIIQITGITSIRYYGPEDPETHHSSSTYFPRMQQLGHKNSSPPFYFRPLPPPFFLHYFHPLEGGYIRAPQR